MKGMKSIMLRKSLAILLVVMMLCSIGINALAEGDNQYEEPEIETMAEPEEQDEGNEAALTVTYNSNWWPEAEVPVDENTYAPGTEVEVLFEPAPEVDGAVFLGWDTDYNVYGNVGEVTAMFSPDGDTTFNIEEDTILYAVWGFEPYREIEEIVALAAGDPATVIYAPGTGGNWDAGDETYSVEEGVVTPVFGGDIATQNKPGYTFTEWSPHVALTVTGSVTYTAQWDLIGVSSGPGGTTTRQWPTTLNNTSFKHPTTGVTFVLPGNAQKLEFDAVATNGQTVLDHAYLVVDEDGNASIIFLCATQSSQFSIDRDYLSFGGQRGTLIGYLNSSIQYLAYKVDLTEEMLGEIANGNLALPFQLNVNNNNGHSIPATTLRITNLSYSIEYYIYDENPWDTTDAQLYRTVPGAGVSGRFVTAPIISIFGYEYTYVSGLTVETGNIPVVLKMYYKSTGVKQWGIVGSSYETMYDGATHSLSENGEQSPYYDVWFAEAEPGEEYEFRGSVVQANPSGTNAGSYDQNLNPVSGYRIFYHGSKMTDGATLIDGYWEDVTAYMGTPGIDKGALTITKKPVTVTTDSATKEYDSTALTADGRIEGIVPGETYSFRVTGSQTTIGSSPNTYSLVWDGSAIENNYTVAGTLGTLTITANSDEIVITVKDNSKVYSGTALVPVEHEVAGLADGFYLDDVVYKGSITNVSESGLGLGGIEYVIRNAAGEDVTDQFNNVRVVNGALTITLRPIEITAYNDSKEYDGDALENPGYDITDGTLAEGQTLDSVVVTGSQTIPGSSGNVASDAVILDADENDVAVNYDITYVDGTLTVTPNPIVIDFTAGAEGAFSKVYGEADPEIDDVQAAIQDEVNKQLEAQGLNAGDIEVTVYGRTEGENVNGSPYAYEISWNLANEAIYMFNNEEVSLAADLTVVKRPAIVKADDKSKTTSQFDPQLTAKAETASEGRGFLNAEDVPEYALARQSGFNVGTYDIYFTEHGDNPNYDISWETGKLTIGTSGGTPTTTIEDELPPLSYYDMDNHFAYIIGYEDDTVRPQRNITRAEVATIFFRLMKEETRADFWSTTNEFPDVNASKWYNNAISTLTNGGLLTGYPDGTFRPEGTITRAEFAVIAVRFQFEGDPDNFPPAGMFSDVSGHWAEGYIAYAYGLGYVQGYEDGTFRPDAPITRAEVATLLNNALNRHVESVEDMLEEMKTWVDNQPGTWYYFAVQEATNSHFYDWKETDEGEDAPWANNVAYEIWTDMRKSPDWALLEKPDSKPGDVVYDTPVTESPTGESAA